MSRGKEINITQCLNYIYYIYKLAEAKKLLKYLVHIKTFVSRFTYYMQSFIYFKLISHTLLHQKKTLPEKNLQLSQN